LILASASKPSSARTTWYPAWVRKISAERRIVLLSSITMIVSAVEGGDVVIFVSLRLEVSR